jgi:transcriptional regulator GlxA family with amidase domain
MTVRSNTNPGQKGTGDRRRVVVLVVPPVEELDLVGPVQVFSAANRLAGRPVYDVEIATNGKSLEVTGEGGLLSFLAQRHYRHLTGTFDSLLLVCGVGTRNARDPALFTWLKEVAPKLRRLGSVCAGSLLLAEAGLLNGRRATSHWRFSEELAKRYPRVKVVSEPVWVKDGNIYTSAGISAGIDLGLGWVEEDCGNGVATEIAREFVLFLRRPSTQAQLSVSLAAQGNEMRSIQELLVWIADHLDRDLSLPVLASRVAMSPRNFERVFRREVGVSPAHYVRRVRVEAAQRLLGRGDGVRLEQIALKCGFSSADAMRRVLKQSLNTTPRALRPFNRL